MKKFESAPVCVLSLMVVMSTSIGGCFLDDDDEGATVRIVNAQSGCTLSEVYVTPAGESKGENLAGSGIRYNSAGTYDVDSGRKYTLTVSSNTTTDNLNPTATCSVTLDGGETREILYYYEGSSFFRGVLDNCD